MARYATFIIKGRRVHNRIRK